MTRRSSSSSNAVIYGDDGDDTITDSGGSDTIDGGTGNDVITDGGSGTNVLRGGDGNDTITYDYTSNNTVEGGAGNDLIKVSSQNTGGYNTFTDTLRGGTGDDRIQSGEQADTYLFDRGDGSDTINDFDAANKGSVDKIVLAQGFCPAMSPLAA